jgi:pyruvate dehydrogenase E2 component (dihydrolipoamide acetyltransferase)
MAEAIEMPKMSDTMIEGVLVSWLAKVGDKVKAGNALAEVETDKATMELESYFDGVLLHIAAPAGSSVPVGNLIAIVGQAGENIQPILDKYAAGAATAAPAAPASVAAAPAPKAASAPVAAPLPILSAVAAAPAPFSNGSSARIVASPLAKALATDKGIDLRALSGTGEGGRIVKRDIEAAATAPAVHLSAVVSAPTGAVVDVPTSQMRKTIARRLSESMFTAPHFYLTVSIDMDQATSLRTQLNTEAERDNGIKISFNDLVVKACALALRKHPKVNSSWLGDVIRSYPYVNVGVAVAVEEGLIVPVIRNADSKGLAQISTETKELAGRAKNKQLQPAEWEGNTFTISNLGMFGIEEFTAIINPPDACILAVGGIHQVPVVKDGAVVPGAVMKVTLSCDHRVVDGATGAEFLKTVKYLLENPLRMLL